VKLKSITPAGSSLLRLYDAMLAMLQPIALKRLNYPIMPNVKQGAALLTDYGVAFISYGAGTTLFCSPSFDSP
jgi:hypothetical protein